MIVMGIDPGMKGGVGVLEDGGIASVHAMPVAAGQVDTRVLAGLLDCVNPDLVVIEQQSILGGQKGALTIGANFGRLLAILEVGDYPHRIVTPAKWNRTAGIPPGLKGKDKKEAAYLVAQKTWGRDFTGLGLRRTQDGLYEALLIARYG